MVQTLEKPKTLNKIESKYSQLESYQKLNTPVTNRTLKNNGKQLIVDLQIDRKLKMSPFILSPVDTDNFNQQLEEMEQQKIEQEPKLKHLSHSII